MPFQGLILIGQADPKLRPFIYQPMTGHGAMSSQFIFLFFARTANHVWARTYSHAPTGQLVPKLWPFIYQTNDRLKNILQVLGTVPELSDALPLTDDTRMTASVLTSKLYDDLRCDSERENFSKICEEYITCNLPANSSGNLHAIHVISGLLQGPFDVGNRLLNLNGVMQNMITLSASEKELEQIVAVEALILAAAKASHANFITTNGVSLLKDIYKGARSEAVMIRALVGLCKLGSAGGTDYSMRQFAEGSTGKLAKQCRKWLCNTALDSRTRRWAVEGLAYLALDADVKEELVQDGPVLQAMLELSQTSDKTVLYAVVSTLVHCTNSYEQKEHPPEMVELAKCTKQHIPEEHPKDKKEFVVSRVKKLLQAGVVSALVCMVKSDSAVLTDACKELMSRIFLALVEDVCNRGTVVAEGGGKALIPLALGGTDTGRTKAAQALAKIAITADPRIAFPGERVYEVVRPLVALLDPEKSALQNFETLMALTNLASISDGLRKKIVKEKAVPAIENYMFEEHEQIRQAATECMCNLVLHSQVQELFVADGNDRLKLLVLYSGEEDEALARAASGALAMLTASRVELFCHPIGVRGLAIVLNLMNAGKDLAECLVASNLVEILSHLAHLDSCDPERKRVTDAAQACLSKAMDYGLIKPYSYKDGSTLQD
uniref:Unc-45 myosin chaperone A n=1 Tax=Eptatretus burgeri TaxID=7764 RepID=A0A8C4Q1G4_EPTBU